MASSDWKWLELPDMAGKSWKWLEMTLWPDVARNISKLLEIARTGWKWLEMVGMAENL